MPPFSLWSFLQDGVCTIAISSYEKYKGGVSVRDVQALVQTAVALSANVLLPDQIRVQPITSFAGGDWHNNQILIGGLLANHATNFLQTLTAPTIVLAKNLLHDTLREQDNAFLEPVFKSNSNPSIDTVITDYGVIMCSPNPIGGQNRVVIALSGVKGFGTLAAAAAFSNPQHYQEIDAALAQLSFDPQGADQGSLVEIILQAQIEEKKRGREILRTIAEVNPVMVRLNGNREREWENPKFTAVWHTPTKPITPNELKQMLTQYFNEAELQDLCFELRVEYENLPGPGKNDKARELVMYMEHHTRLKELTDTIRRLRPHQFP
jgi:hypothetical protein